MDWESGSTVAITRYDKIFGKCGLPVEYTVK